jgi:hypothetical protein
VMPRRMVAFERRRVAVASGTNPTARVEGLPRTS